MLTQRSHLGLVRRGFGVEDEQRRSHAIGQRRTRMNKNKKNYYQLEDDIIAIVSFLIFIGYTLHGYV